ncbi:hypothetical protein [Alkalihalobacillus sp. AL-G]|uniref:hypothetical protein n=1 Tax=Alkalihalobacillus sp. AL-G TaxID=2926399 RepID=UPI00272A5D77|nr:hypothetical protein [Alkalihalobacillus sp. AL-G]WLD91793.1 hypothetical protein MOJ78_12165 [Alkalihalobacillus sp. AL-G]
MKKWIYILATMFFVTTGIGISYYYYVIQDHREEQNKAIAAAKKEYGFNNVQDIEHYYGSYGSYQVIQTNIDQEKMYVFVPVKKGEERTINADEGWNKTKVKQYVTEELHPEKLISIHLGLEKYTTSSNFTPVWEIVYKEDDDTYTFHYIRFSDGSLFKEYRMNQTS